MFSKLKQFKDLRSQAKTMQNALAGESIIVEKNGIKISLNGNLEIISITLNENLNKNSQEESLKDCLNDAIKKAQRLMAKKMQEMGGLPGLM
ncbi:MAG: YbaB/EbfC family nucleoid-associated protein [Candidatus Falkowbacteria bacterium]|nr:YbaB/EbfC family nucleoid-associated protein [Candidatus Falkowbacteria bacterium]